MGQAAGDTVLLKQEGLPLTVATNLEKPRVWLQLLKSQSFPLANHQSLSETPTSIPKHKRRAAACGCPTFYCYKSNWKQWTHSENTTKKKNDLR